VFISADATDRAGRVRAAFASLRTERRTVSAREDHVARFTWFLVPALLLLLVDTWIATRSRGAARAPALGESGGDRLRAAAALALVVTGVMSGCARPPDPALRLEQGDALGAVSAYRALVAAGDTSYEMRYNLATALLAADSLPEAMELFEVVRRATDGEVRARARFNAGLAQLIEARAASGDTAGGEAADRAFAAARELYRAYLGERFDDEDGKWNYELALRPQPPMGGGGGGGSDRDDASEQPEESPASGQLDRAQAEALLNSAARDERDVQGKRQRMTRQPPPPGGRDW
jgi:Ca-activated chloride channel family protein